MAVRKSNCCAFMRTLRKAFNRVNQQCCPQHQQHLEAALAGHNLSCAREDGILSLIYTGVGTCQHAVLGHLA